jgi:hypothetical protein
LKIKIGDKNKISKSEIGHKYVSTNGNDSNKKKSFINRHPIIVSILTSLLASFILLFSFWGHVISWIENFFK